MHKLMTGEDDSFDKSFYNELVSCIKKYDPELMDVIDAQWKGFRTYAEKGEIQGLMTGKDVINMGYQISNL